MMKKIKQKGLDDEAFVVKDAKGKTKPLRPSERHRT